MCSTSYASSVELRCSTCSCDVAATTGTGGAGAASGLRESSKRRSSGSTKPTGSRRDGATMRRRECAMALRVRSLSSRRATDAGSIGDRQSGREIDRNDQRDANRSFRPCRTARRDLPAGAFSATGSFPLQHRYARADTCLPNARAGDRPEDGGMTIGRAKTQRRARRGPHRNLYPA